MTSVIINASAFEADACMLHLLYHRNKNQHRLTKWWKWLSMLRRCVAKLLLDLQSHDQHLAKPRVKHLQETLLPGCHLNFSQVVADGQFAGLGVVLLGLVARINVLVLLPGTQEEIVDHGSLGSVEAVWGVEDVMVIEDLGRPVLRPPEPLEGRQAGGREMQKEKEDVQAGPEERGDLGSEMSITSPKPHRRATSASQQIATKKKKGAKKRNAIDDLFRGIG
ncbi:hypothetical protein MMC30_005541 [Trapelia coarctata]|nr:hypothetical protein [Trapelia coarctata]